MSASMHATAIRPPDELWLKHKAVWDACTAAGVAVPDMTIKFFNYETPDDAGVTISLDKHMCCSEWRDGYREGYEIDLSKLPPDVKKIRVYMAY